jgi:hypothetical protein
MQRAPHAKNFLREIAGSGGKQAGQRPAARASCVAAVPFPLRRSLSMPLPRPAVLAALATLAAAPVAAQQPQRPLAALAFMAGCWRGDAGVDRTIEEQWTAANSNVMLATTRYLDDNTGRTRGWEFSRIVADSAGIVLYPAPAGSQRGRFRLAPSRAGEAVFQDPSHDSPKRIIYRRVDGRRMVVHLDDGEGSHQAVEFRMERVPCPAAPQ